MAVQNTSRTLPKKTVSGLRRAALPGWWMKATSAAVSGGEVSLDGMANPAHHIHSLISIVSLLIISWIINHHHQWLWISSSYHHIYQRCSYNKTSIHFGDFPASHVANYRRVFWFGDLHSNKKNILKRPLKHPKTNRFHILEVMVGQP